MLVADPRRTKVNVKAELSRPGVSAAARVSDCSSRTRYIDLPPGVSPSAIGQLQVENSFKLAVIENTG